jgi:DHA1 family inner membrane transport protein
MKVNWPLLALAVGAFAIGTTEFSPMGFLPEVANSLAISIPKAGTLISAYAVGVLLGAPFMTLGLGRTRTKTALIALMCIFVIGNLLAASAPGFATLLAARVITSLTHGAFFGLGTVAATRVVPKGKEASAVATMLSGLTIANIGGVPAATWMGQVIGWRSAFVAIACLGLLTIVALFFAMARGDVGELPNIRREVAVLSRPSVQAALATTSLASGALFVVYTYISPFLAHLTGASASFVTAMLVLIGIGFTLGNGAGGRLADRSVRLSLLLTLGLLATILLFLPVVAGNRFAVAVALMLWGAAFFAAVPGLQMRVMQVAHEAPGLASSVNIGAFNLGNAFGAAAGGVALSLGFGYASLPIVGAAFAVLAFFVVLLSGRRSAVSVAATT